MALTYVNKITTLPTCYATCLRTKYYRVTSRHTYKMSRVNIKTLETIQWTHIASMTFKNAWTLFTSPCPCYFNTCQILTCLLVEKLFKQVNKTIVVLTMEKVLQCMKIKLVTTKIQIIENRKNQNQSLFSKCSFGS